LQKCPYCDFLSVAAPRADIPHAAYAAALCREIRARAPQVGARPVHSVFIGGGTPSLWEPAELGRVLAALRTELHLSANVEITVECNPSSFSSELGRALLDLGVNRLSIGVQALDEKRLQFLGRLHDAGSGLAAIEQGIASGIPNISADLIYGVYSQDPASARAEVGRVADLGPSHVSAYALTVEPGTAFGARARKGTLPLLGDDAVADSFVAVHEALAERGFTHYEVSNFARPGSECRHNLGYWRGEPYLGLGCGAWGTLRDGGTGLRYRNTPSPERYLALERWPLPQPDRLDPSLQQAEQLSPETLLSERILLGLRLREGIHPQATSEELGVPFFTPSRTKAVHELSARGQLEQRDGRLYIPEQAWLFADGVIRELL
jgi:oxygen-independent coproporphyrinogen-3 oxidase